MINTLCPAIIGDPFAFKNSSDSEQRIMNRDPRDPDQAPQPEKGDRHILLWTMIGIIIGGVAGFLIGMYGFGRSGVFLGILVGVIAGGFIGSWIGSIIKRKASEQDEKESGMLGMS